MECPYCGAELEYEDCYGPYKNGQIQKVGDIYRCPNHEGFQTVEEVQDYLDATDDDLDTYCAEHGFIFWEEITCESSMHRVSGSFYTDEQGNLHEGYPC